MRKLLILISILYGTFSYSQLSIETNVLIDNVNIKHMEENQYNQVSSDNIDSNIVALYLEEYQAYSLMIIDANKNEYYFTLKIRNDKIEMICSCEYSYSTFLKLKL